MTPKPFPPVDDDFLSVGSDGSDNDIDEKQHYKLLNAITNLDGKKKYCHFIFL